MIDWVVQYQGLIREVINGYAMVQFLVLSAMVAAFMWDSVVDWFGNPPRTWASWNEVPGIKTACALWWVFIAETYRTGSLWYLYQLGEGQHEVNTFFDAGSYWSSYGYLFAGVLLNVGLLRAIYIFTPPEWKDRVWVYASLAGLIFAASPIIYSSLRDYINGV